MINHFVISVGSLGYVLLSTLFGMMVWRLVQMGLKFNIANLWRKNSISKLDITYFYLLNGYLPSSSQTWLGESTLFRIVSMIFLYSEHVPIKKPPLIWYFPWVEGEMTHALSRSPPPRSSPSTLIQETVSALQSSNSEGAGNPMDFYKNWE